MACKHEGGTDPCERYADKHCIAKHRIRSKQYYKDHLESCKRKINAYMATYIEYSGSTASPANLGASAELVVAADLLHRGFAVTRPLNVNGPHDLHVEISNKWYGIQVRHGCKNRNSKSIRASFGAAVSPILAAVFRNEVQYYGNKKTGALLPRELK